MKKLMYVFLAVIMLLTSMVSANAAEVAIESIEADVNSVSSSDILSMMRSNVDTGFDGLSVTLTTNKEVYQKGESIFLTIELNNTSTKAIKNIAIENILPEGFEYCDVSYQENNFQNYLNPGESSVYTREIRYSADIENEPDNDAPENNTPESSAPESNTPESSTPENNTPESSAPENNTPGSSTPESSAPENSTPESSAPESSTSQSGNVQNNNANNANNAVENQTTDEDNDVSKGKTQKPAVKTEEEVVEVEETVIDSEDELIEETESVEETQQVEETQEIMEEEIPMVDAKADEIIEASGKSNTALIVVLCIAALIFIAVMIVLILKKKKAQQLLSLILCAVLTASSINLLEVKATTVSGGDMNVTTTTVEENVSIDNESVTVSGNDASSVALFSNELTARSYSVSDSTLFTYNETEYEVVCNVSFVVAEENVKEYNMSIDTSMFNYNEEYKAYAVYSKVDTLKGTLDEANDFSTITLEIYNEKNQLVQKKEIASAAQWSFSQVGLFPGLNHVIVTASGEETLVVKVNLFDVYGTNYDVIDDAVKDTDGDGLYDLLEDYYGTNKSEADTDKDGLTDYQEIVEVGTDAVIADTDKDGISDYEEDADGDGLSNGKEYAVGTEPMFTDSDFDGLTDSEELNKYFTNPTNADTDGDGADDLWEISMGYDPTVRNESFVLEYATGSEVNENRPIVASVKLTLTSGDVESLSIKPVSSYDNPLLSPSIAGYLGTAYDFSVDGEFDTAEMTFNYDSSLGTLGDDFQPRIYYFNESTMMLEELPNQKVTENSVTATVEHFSTYILLNKVPFDEVWEAEIKPVDSEGSEYTGIDVVFVIDSSGSMSTNDGNKLRLEAANAFVDKLGEFDRAAVVDFDGSAKTLQGFTSDHDLLKNAIAKIDQSGGTNLSTGMLTALSLFTSTSYVNNNAYKYIVFLTDGDGSYSTAYTTMAAENNVIIYTVGLGSGVRESVLKDIANGTGGKYYFASVANQLGGIYDEISVETVDYTTDSNNDGITDYYTNLIKEGTLVLSTGSSALSGIDLNYDADGNLSNDWDKDGLRNDQEIMIVTNGDRTYIYMKSNPLLKHSDGDGIADNVEVQNGTDPLRYTVAANQALVSILTDDQYYDYERVVDTYKDSLIAQGSNAIGSLVFGVWNKKELYRDLIIEYYSKYVTNETLEQQLVQEEKKNAVEFLNTALDNVKKYGGAQQSLISEINQLICNINEITDETEVAHALADKVAPLVTKLHNISEEATKFRFETYGLPYEMQLKNVSEVADQITTGWKALDKVSKGITVAGYGLDVVDSIYNVAQVSVNNEAFNTNIDALNYMIDNSEDKYARNAALQVRNCLAGKYFGEIVKTVGADLLESAVDFAISELAAKNPYSLAVVAVRDAMELLFNVSEDIKQLYQMLCYHEISKTYKKLFSNSVYSVSNGQYYNIYDSSHHNFMRYINNLTQIRVLGEILYYEWYEATGLLKGIVNYWNKLDEVKAYVNEQLEGLKMIADILQLSLSSKLKFVI